MADTRPASGLTPQQWDDKFTKEYYQENPFTSVKGAGQNSIIQVREDFEKGNGDNLTIALVNRLDETDNGTLGSDVLEGNEDDMSSRSFKFTVNKRRKAVRHAEMDAYRNAINLRDASKEVLMDWAIQNEQIRILNALKSINGVKYETATEAQKDTWLTDNADRVLFGAAKSNASANDHSAALGNVDATNDTLTASAASLMKRMALARRTDGKPAIKPIRVKGQNRRYFKVYVGPRAFRDLKTDSVITAAQREVSLEKENNRLFEGGDIIWDGMIFHEWDAITPIEGVGNGGIDVEPVFFCGAQALVHGVAKRFKTKTKTFDYGDKYGCAVEAIDGFHKVRYGAPGGDYTVDDTLNPYDHGLLTGYFAAVADS